jgi:hypothetical protein
MASAAKSGVGTLLKLGDGASPEVFTAIAEILTLKIGGRSINTADVTNMDSAADGNGVIYKEFIGTLAEGGDVDFTYNFVPSATGGQASFRSAFNAQLHNFKIVTTINNAASPVAKFTFSFAGIVSECDNVDFPIDKQIVGSGKIKVSGPITLA